MRFSKLTLLVFTYFKEMHTCGILLYSDENALKPTEAAQRISQATMRWQEHNAVYVNYLRTETS